MSIDSDGKLTKFESTVTVITADFANSIFGGLYGSGAGSSLDADDPRVRGHVHDGEHVDGHLQRIHLIHHVEAKLQHANLGTPAVNVDNVYKYTEIGSAIPEYIVDSTDGLTYYYLDLRIIRSDFTFHEVEDPDSAHSSSSVDENRLIRQRIEPDWEGATGYDFVFGSASLENMNGFEATGTTGDSRFLFDKSQGSFRAGSADEAQWDEANRGGHSAAFGQNNTASGSHSVVSGGAGNTASAPSAVIGGGGMNTASALYTTVGGGLSNTASGQTSTVSGGASNTASETYSTVGGGGTNNATALYSTISGGVSNNAAGNYSTISGGQGNTANAAAVRSTISGGQGNSLDGEFGTIGGGYYNTADGYCSATAGGNSNDSDSDYAAVLGGQGNHANSEHSAVAGGYQNIIAESSINSFIGSGHQNNILDASNHSTIGGGVSNNIGVTAAELPATHSTIGGGQGNNIYGSSTHSAIGGGGGNNIYGLSTYATIGGGGSNSVWDSAIYGTVSGGLSNRAKGQYAVSCGGNNNSADGNLASVVGGNNNQVIGDNSFIGGGGGGTGSGNSVSAANSAIVGGSAITVGSGYSIIGGGAQNTIGSGSDHSVIMGGGGSGPAAPGVNGDGNTISIGFEVDLDDDQIIEEGCSGPSPTSGIYGGSGNRIGAGGSDPGVFERGHNFIFGGFENHIAIKDDGPGLGPDPHAGIAHSYIAGGQNNLILGVGGSFAEPRHMFHNVIGFGTSNRIQTGEASIDNCLIVCGTNNQIRTNNDWGGITTHCAILSGYENSFADQDPMTSKEFGAQTSAILSGARNCITTSTAAFVGTNSATTCFSTIVGGFKNSIGDSRGSVICGGGAHIDLKSGTYGGMDGKTAWEYLPGYVWDSTDLNPADHSGGANPFGNQITWTNNAGILCGVNNYIWPGEAGRSDNSSIVSGYANEIAGGVSSSILYGNKNIIGPSPVTVTHPSFASACGFESVAYLYGQSAQASGGFSEGFENLGNHSAGGDSDGEDKGLYGGGPGSAQTFVFTMRGHWNNYTEEQFPDGSGASQDYGGTDPWPHLHDARFNCFLDDGTTPRVFEPRNGSTYAFRIQGTLACTGSPATSGDTMETVAFTYTGGMVVRENGTGEFGATDVHIDYASSFGGLTPTLGNVGGSDFLVVFTNEPSAPQRGGTIDTTSAHPAKFYIDVTNNTGRFMCASLVARVEMTECRHHYVHTSV